MTISRRGFFGVMGIGSLIPVNSVAEIKDEIRIIRIRWRKPRNDYTLIINGQLIDTKECHYEFKAKKNDNLNISLREDSGYPMDYSARVFDSRGNLVDWFGRDTV
jgi:hypothetical protein